jgi:hypothetical protein
VSMADWVGVPIYRWIPSDVCYAEDWREVGGSCGGLEEARQGRLEHQQLNIDLEQRLFRLLLYGVESMGSSCQPLRRAALCRYIEAQTWEHTIG